MVHESIVELQGINLEITAYVSLCIGNDCTNKCLILSCPVTCRNTIESIRIDRKQVLYCVSVTTVFIGHSCVYPSTIDNIPTEKLILSCVSVGGRHPELIYLITIWNTCIINEIAVCISTTRLVKVRLNHRVVHEEEVPRSLRIYKYGRFQRAVSILRACLVEVYVTLACILIILFPGIPSYLAILPRNTHIRERLVVIRTFEHHKVLMGALVEAPCRLVHLTAAEST